MKNYCFDCGNAIRKGHNKKLNRKDAGDNTVNVKHIDDVCECEKPISQYTKEAAELFAKMKYMSRKVDLE